MDGGGQEGRQRDGGSLLQAGRGRWAARCGQERCEQPIANSANSMRAAHQRLLALDGWLPATKPCCSSYPLQPVPHCTHLQVLLHAVPRRGVALQHVLNHAAHAVVHLNRQARWQGREQWADEERCCCAHARASAHLHCAQPAPPACPPCPGVPAGLVRRPRPPHRASGRPAGWSNRTGACRPETAQPAHSPGRRRPVVGGWVVGGWEGQRDEEWTAGHACMPIQGGQPRQQSGWRSAHRPAESAATSRLAAPHHGGRERRGGRLLRGYAGCAGVVEPFGGQAALPAAGGGRGGGALFVA